ncbi:hypothetical protein EVAR_100680_1 [Eumeta japonica]|uniref:Uncharacterized protein n=1 Tax=Eumeta variegata TaxID=151549 RepID=A0A4C2A7H5_EUMVA|nr:hypothetical protein EVAR_100680_1 [Eumeta japonica]
MIFSSIATAAEAGAARSRRWLRTSRRPALTLLRTTLTQLVNLIVCIQIRLAAQQVTSGAVSYPRRILTRGVDAPRATAGKRRREGRRWTSFSVRHPARIYWQYASGAPVQATVVRDTLSRLRPATLRAISLRTIVI